MRKIGESCEGIGGRIVAAVIAIALVSAVALTSGCNSPPPPDRYSKESGEMAIEARVVKDFALVAEYYKGRNCVAAQTVRDRVEDPEVYEHRMPIALVVDGKLKHSKRAEWDKMSLDAGCRKPTTEEAAALKKADEVKTTAARAQIDQRLREMEPQIKAALASGDCGVIRMKLQKMEDPDAYEPKIPAGELWFGSRVKYMGREKYEKEEELLGCNENPSCKPVLVKIGDKEQAFKGEFKTAEQSTCLRLTNTLGDRLLGVRSELTASNRGGWVVSASLGGRYFTGPFELQDSQDELFVVSVDFSHDAAGLTATDAGQPMSEEWPGTMSFTLKLTPVVAPPTTAKP